MVKFLLWCLLFVLCWPLALLALFLYPLVWLLLLPFRILGERNRRRMIGKSRELPVQVARDHAAQRRRPVFVDEVAALLGAVGRSGLAIGLRLGEPPGRDHVEADRTGGAADRKKPALSASR